MCEGTESERHHMQAGLGYYTSTVIVRRVPHTVPASNMAGLSPVDRSERIGSSTPLGDQMTVPAARHSRSP
jgi:hypothetical protein